MAEERTMGYRVVTVNPLKPFPIASFGLANVMSLDDAKKQLMRKHQKDGTDGLSMESHFRAGKLLKEIENGGFTDELKAASEKFLVEIKNPHDNFYTEVLLFETRWPRIEPALKAHLARQERRLAHFNSACRFKGCDNPHRQKRGGGTGTKANRPGVKPIFCGGHIGLRKCLTDEMLRELRASNSKRVAVV